MMHQVSVPYLPLWARKVLSSRFHKTTNKLILSLYVKCAVSRHNLSQYSTPSQKVAESSLSKHISSNQVKMKLLFVKMQMTDH